MSDLLRKTAKSAGGKAVPTLLGVCIALALGAYAVGLAASPRPDYSLTPSPTTRTIAVGQSATYTVSVNRVNRFNEPVALSIAAIPAGSSASWRLGSGPSSPNTITVPAGTSAATLTIATTNGTAAGSYAPKITGAAGKLTRSATVQLVVQAPESGGNAVFGIAAPQVPALYPGAERNLDVRLRNPNNFPIKVSELNVAVDEATTGADGPCSGTANYAGRPYSGSAAIVVPADGAWHPLSGLGVMGRHMPKVVMHELGTNQDGCKNATITLRYTGTATK